MGICGIGHLGMAGACGIWGSAGMPPWGICGSAGIPPCGICGMPPRLTLREMRIGAVVIGTRAATSGGGGKATDARPLSSRKISTPVASLSLAPELPVVAGAAATRARDAAGGRRGRRGADERGRQRGGPLAPAHVHRRGGGPGGR